MKKEIEKEDQEQSISLRFIRRSSFSPSLTKDIVSQWPGTTFSLVPFSPFSLSLLHFLILPLCSPFLPIFLFSGHKLQPVIRTEYLYKRKMQFTENYPHPSPLAAKTPPFNTPSDLTMNKNQTFINRADSWPGFPTPKSLSTAGFGDPNCLEQLLVHCATAFEANDATLAQQILWVLNNIAPPEGDSSQRLTSGFLRALITRAAKSGSCKLLPAVAEAGGADLTTASHKFSIIELARFIDLTPWHRFGFTAANAAVLDAVEGYSVVHVVDLSLTHCMQIPTLIDSFAARLDPPPLVKLTVAGATEDYPPLLDLSYDELGAKLVNFASSRNVAMEFRVIPSSSSNGFSSLIEHLRLQKSIRAESNEALVINCHMMLHYLPEETLILGSSLISIDESPNNSLRTMFLEELRNLNPTIVVLIDEDADFTSNNLVNRLRSAYNYLWIPYDTVDALLPKASIQRRWYEADIYWKIENVISREGPQRVERVETKSKWVQRMRNACFGGVAFSEDATTEVKNMLEEHAAGWGLKKEEEDHLVLTWKGHNTVFATVWTPV